MAGKEQRSALLGFSACPLCGGKTHVKRRTDVEGKKPYSHCLDETEVGCNHTHYAKNPTEERLMLAKMRPLPGGAAPTATRDAAPASAAAAAPAPITPAPAPAAPKRSGLFGFPL